MSFTVRDITGNADLFRAAFPNWPSPEPERPTFLDGSAEPTDIGGRTLGEMVRDERMTEASELWPENWSFAPRRCRPSSATA